MTQRKIRLGVAGLGRAFTLMLPTLVGDERIVVRIDATASGADRAISTASACAAASTCSKGTSRSSRPIRWASSPFTRAPV